MHQLLTALRAVPSPGFWDKALEQAPVLTVASVVFIVVTLAFLRTMRKLSADVADAVKGTNSTMASVLDFLSDADSRNKRLAIGHADSVQALTDSCHAFQMQLSNQADARAEKVIAVVDRNTAALGRNTVALEHVEGVLEDIARK